MKKLLFIFGIFALVSCAPTAVSYYANPNCETKDLGKIVGVVDAMGYSILSVENFPRPIYIEGKMPKIEIPSEEHAQLMESSKQNYFVFKNKKYLIDKKTEI